MAGALAVAEVLPCQSQGFSLPSKSDQGKFILRCALAPTVDWAWCQALKGLGSLALPFTSCVTLGKLLDLSDQIKSNLS